MSGKYTISVESKNKIIQINCNFALDFAWKYKSDFLCANFHASWCNVINLYLEDDDDDDGLHGLKAY